MTGQPVIGVTTYHERAVMGVWDVDATFLPDAYAAPLTRAGAAWVALSPQPAHPGMADALVERLDGIYLSGGYDVSPALYGAPPHPQTDAPRRDRDAWERALVDATRRHDVPLLGVCRGAQLLNVARGGTLHQHVPDLVGHERHQGADGVFSSMRVHVAPGSMLGSLHDPTREVPVYHHQAIDRVGEGLTVVARSDDGIVEAIEDRALAFCLAVQWHPEHDPGAQPLFDAFVAASAARAAARAPVRS